MTPYEIEQADQRRIEAQDVVAQDLYLDGMTDATSGDKAQRIEEPYLLGYCAGLKQLPCKDGRIQYPSPYQHFAMGYVDSPHDGFGDAF